MNYEREIENLRDENVILKNELKNIKGNHDNEVNAVKFELKNVCEKLRKYKQNSARDKINLSSLKETIKTKNKEIITLKNSHCKYAHACRNKKSGSKNKIIIYKKSTQRALSPTLRNISILSNYRMTSPNIQTSRRNVSSIGNKTSLKNSTNNIITVLDPISCIQPRELPEKNISKISSSKFLKTSQYENNDMTDQIGRAHV